MIKTNDQGCFPGVFVCFNFKRLCHLAPAMVDQTTRYPQLTSSKAILKHSSMTQRVVFQMDICMLKALYRDYPRKSLQPTTTSILYAGVTAHHTLPFSSSRHPSYGTSRMIFFV